MIRVIGPTPRNPTSALIPVAREDLDKLDKRTTLYVLADVAVVLSPCWCGAGYNELCRGSMTTWGGRTHADRRMAAKKTKGTLGLNEQLNVAYLMQPHYPPNIPKVTLKRAGGYDPRKPRKKR